MRIEQRDDIWYYAIIHISTSESSNEARSRIIDGIIAWESNETERIISEQGLDVNTTLNPVRWDGEVSQGDVATQGEQAGMVLSLFIPLVLVHSVFLVQCFKKYLNYTQIAIAEFKDLYIYGN